MVNLSNTYYDMGISLFGCTPIHITIGGRIGPLETGINENLIKILCFKKMHLNKYHYGKFRTSPNCCKYHNNSICIYMHIYIYIYESLFREYHTHIITANDWNTSLRFLCIISTSYKCHIMWRNKVSVSDNGRQLCNNTGPLFTQRTDVLP